MNLSIILIILSILTIITVTTTTVNSHSHAGRIARPHPYNTAAAIKQQESGSKLLLSIGPQSPQQILTALTGITGEVSISWLTTQYTLTSIIQYGNSNNNLNNTIIGTSYNWTDPAELHRIRIIHSVLINELDPNELIYYRVGDISTGIYSNIYQYKVPPAGSEILTMIVYGDMGVINSQSMESVLAEVEAGSVDIVLHVGDFAYDLHSDNGTVGDIFMNLIQPISTAVPYMGCAGNHDSKYNSSHYSNRFMAYNEAGINSNSNTNWWYSWDYISGNSRVHMIAINTEVYYTYEDQYKPPDLSLQRQKQYEWLNSDLLSARESGIIDWIIVYGHRPMYCSNVDDMPDCSTDAQTLRLGFNFTEYGIEQLLMKYSVDLYLTAHEHSYERSYPVFNGAIDPNIIVGHTNHTYTKPLYPVHILSGSAGCQEYYDYYDSVFYGPWSVVRSSTYGYGRLRIHNSTVLHWEQLLDEGKGGTDQLWIIK